MSSEHPSSLYRWTVLGIIMLGTFMAILDSSIVMVALPPMMSAFGVTRDKIEWVATAFMLASAAVMPLVGWLAGRLGYKMVYLSCLFIFTAASAGCALAWSYESLVAMRVLQAIGGGAIQPIGMAIVGDLFEPHERGKALGVWGTGVMVAPALGPTLGGYLTDISSWRTIFSVNLPIGAVTLLAGLMIMRNHGKRNAKPLDIFGYGFLTMALVSSLIALSNGQQEGWGSNYILTCWALATIGFVMFIGIELAVKYPILDLALFKARNYSLSIVLAVFRAIGLFGGVFLLPIFLQNLAGYTTIQSGMWMIPAAVAVGVMMPISGRLADRYGPRGLAALGSAFVGVSLLMFGNLDPMSGWPTIIIPQVLRGFGLALMMAPLITAALNAVPKHEIPMASSFFSVAQNVGGAIGIAVMNTHVTNEAHRHAVRIGELLPVQSQDFARFAQRASEMVIRQSPGILPTPQVKSAFAAAQGMLRRAQVLGFDNGFVFAGWVIIAAIPLCLFLKASEHHKRGGGPAVAAE